MLKIVRKCFQKYFQLVIIHRFNYEALIMWEEEETSWFSLTFSSLKRLISVSLCWEWVFNDISVNLIHFSDLLKFFGSIFKDCDLFIDNQHSLNLIVINHTFYLAIVQRSDSFFATLVSPNTLSFVSRSKLVSDEVIILSFIPLFWIFDFNSIESAYPH